MTYTYTEQSGNFGRLAVNSFDEWAKSPKKQSVGVYF